MDKSLQLSSGKSGLSLQTFQASRYKKSFLILAAVLALTLVWEFLPLLTQENAAFILKLRLPRFFALLFAGTALALSTQIFHSCLHNPIISPALLGMDRLFLLFQTAGVFFNLRFFNSANSVSNDLINFAVSLILLLACGGSLIFSFLGKEKSSPYALLLAGMVLNLLFQALQSALGRLINPSEYLVVQDLGTASFRDIKIPLLITVWILYGLAFIIFRRDLKALDLMVLGRSKAKSLGLAYDKTLRNLLLFTLLLSALATALVGPLSFFGILAANLARKTCDTARHRLLLPYTAVLGLALLFLGLRISEDVFNRLLPLADLINLTGGIFLAYNLVKKGVKP